MCIVCLAGTEQGVQRVVSRNDKAGEVDEELSSNIEEDEEEVEGEETEENVDFGNAGLLFEVLGHRVLAELLVNGANMMVCFILKRHFDYLRRGQVSLTSDAW